MKFSKPWYVVLLAVSVLPACKIVLQLPDGGEIQSATDANNCTSDECTIDWDGSAPFIDTFTPVPPEDARFVQWKQESGYLCGGSTEPCSVVLPAHPVFASDISVYLEPIFQALSDDRSPEPSEPDTSDASFAKAWTPSTIDQCSVDENVSPTLVPVSEAMATIDFERRIYEPSIVYTDETFTMLLRRDWDTPTMTVGDAVNDRATFYAVDDPDSEALLYDDGTHGDVTAGDGVYTRSCLAVDLDILGGFPNTFEQSYDLFYGNPALRGSEPVTQVSKAVRMNDAGIFVTLGDQYASAMGRGRHWEIFNPGSCVSCQQAWHHFGDIFDFFVLSPREAFAGQGYTRVHDFITGTGHEPTYANDSYWPNGMGDGKEHPEYIGMVYSGWPFGGSGISHELAHGLLGINTRDFPATGDGQWNSGDGFHIDGSSTLRGNLQGPLWDPVRGFPIPVKFDDGSSPNPWDLPDAAFVADDNGGVELTGAPDDVLKWADIFLYMMGLMDSSEATERYYKVVNPTLEDCYSTDQYYVCSGTTVVAEELVEFGVSDLIERYGPWGSNVESFDPTYLKVGMLLASDRLHTDAEITLFSQANRVLISTAEDEAAEDDALWYWSTGGRSRFVIDFRNYLLPSQ